MNKRQIILLACCILFSIGVLFSLFALSPYADDVPRQPFKRHFNAGVVLQKERQINLKVNSFYIAGTTEHTLYLGNWTGPFHIVKVSLPALDTSHFNVSLKDIKSPKDFRSFRLKVDSPYFYLSHGTLPGIFKGKISRREAANFLPIDQAPYFVDAFPLSPTRFALKSLNSLSREDELATLTLDSPYLEFKPNVLEKQIDGIFCVEGMLRRSDRLNELVYLYSYRNEYIVLDTNLNVINRHHTIDTFSHAQINIAKIESKNYSTLASPPARINLQSCVYDKYLFIRSPLLAKNEDKLEFQIASPIDVYDITQGKYLYSFHLKSFDGQHEPSSFAVIDKHLVAVYDHFLVIYKLLLPTAVLN